MILLFVLALGEEEAFAYLYSPYKGLMLQKAYAILHDRMLAEDAVSEAFLRIYRNRHKVDDPASDRSLSFVMTIVRNTALTLYNRERRQPPALPRTSRPILLTWSDTSSPRSPPKRSWSSSAGCRKSCGASFCSNMPTTCPINKSGNCSASGKTRRPSGSIGRKSGSWPC